MQPKKSTIQMPLNNCFRIFCQKVYQPYKLVVSLSNLRYAVCRGFATETSKMVAHVLVVRQRFGIEFAGGQLALKMTNRRVTYRKLPGQMSRYCSQTHYLYKYHPRSPNIHVLLQIWASRRSKNARAKFV